MIRGLYEAHLPVRNLKVSIPFYESLGLKLYKRGDNIAFFWIKENELARPLGRHRIQSELSPLFTTYRLSSKFT